MSRASPAYARFASFLIRLGEVPFFGLSSALAAGLAGSGAVLHYSFAELLLAAGLLLLAAGIALGRRRPVLALVTALGGVFMGGMTLGLAQRDAPPRGSVASLLSRGRLPLGDVIEFDGCVAEEATERGSDMALLVDLRGLKLAGNWVPARGRVPVRYAIPPDPGTAVALPVDYGDRIRGWARFDVPRNYANPGAIDFAGALRRKGIHILARVRSPRLFETLAGDCGSLWGRTAASLRRRVQTQLARLRDQGKARQAAILGCVVLGDDAHLDPAAREAFQNSGTYHVLVVSGLHVAWIAWLLWRILRFCPLPPWGSRALIAAAIFFYAEVVGFQASVTRCLWMLALCFVGQSVFRRAAPLNVVFAAGFCLLAVRPDWLFDAGFQLSFTSVLAIVSLAVPLIDRAFRPCWDPLRFAGRGDRLFSRQGTWHRFGRRIRVTTELFAEACGDRLGRPLEAVILRCARCAGRAALAISTMVWISVAVQLWLAPVLAFYFNRISWIVPLANLLAVPAASILLCMGLLAALCAGVLVPASWAYGVAAAVSSLLWQITEWLGSISGSWQRCPTPPAAWVVAGLVLMGTWSVLGWRRKWIPAVLICIQLFCLSTAWRPGLEKDGTRPQSQSAAGPDDRPSRLLKLSFLDVGQGDCTILTMPGGEVWIIDAGSGPGGVEEAGRSSGADLGEIVVSRYLWSQWTARVDRVCMSHPHRDHAGGLPSLLRSFAPRHLCYAPPHWREAIDLLQGWKGAPVSPGRMLGKGQEEALGPVRVRYIHPPAGASVGSYNQSSLVFRLEYRSFTVLFTGDLEAAGEVAVTAGAPELSSLLLKVPHHGSRTAARDAFLRRVQPRWAVISSGRNNPFGNPSPETVMRLIRAGARPLMTQDHGAVFFETDGTTYRLHSHRCGELERGRLPEPREYAR